MDSWPIWSAFYIIEETPVNRKTTQTNAGLFDYFSDIAEMRGLSIIASVKGNRTNLTNKKKGRCNNALLSRKTGI